MPTKFINIGVGYNETCSKQCATKLQWSRALPTRKELLRKRFVEENPGKNTSRKGVKNRNKYPKTEAVLAKWKAHPCPSWIGKTHSLETKMKMSTTRLDKINAGEIQIVASYKGRFAPNNPQKYKGNHTNIIYRSLWELKLMMKLDGHPDVLQWSSEEIRIPYISPLDGRRHTYFVDFYVKMKTRDNTIKEVLIEVKPKYQTVPPKVQDAKRPTKKYLREVSTWGVNSAKWEAAKRYCEERGWTFEIFHEDHLGITKPLRG